MKWIFDRSIVNYLTCNASIFIYLKFSLFNLIYYSIFHNPNEVISERYLQSTTNSTL